MNSHSEQQKRFSDFLAHEYSNLVSYVRRNWQGKTYAEDIVQDVALNLFTKVDFNTPIENLMAYMYRSLKNKIIDLRRKKQEARLDDYEDAENGENLLLGKMQYEPSDPEDEYEQEKRFKLMIDTLEELRPDQHEIIIATELEGYTFEELSQEWDIPIGTLLSRKHRAMTKLQKLVKEKDAVMGKKV
ncbi:MAG: RNA polymerase sigma factor [Bacteroidales bacterium]|nr:RNA polymerase sigma factor [Bacteroidales bacterium]